MFWRNLLKRRRNARRGAMSIEMVGIIAVMGMLLSFAAKQMDQSRHTSQATSFAHQLNLVSKGAQNYLDANAATLLSELESRDYIIILQDRVTTPTNQVINTIEGSAGEGLDPYMPVNFRHTNYGQNVKMYVYKGPDGALHAIFGTTGGAPTSADQDTRDRYLNIAREASGMNGFGMRLNRSVGGNPIEGGRGAIVGQNDSWRFLFSDSDYGNIPPAAFEEYQLAKPLYSFSAAVKDDMLYRVAIEGHPELNAMQTDLHMNGFQITDVGTITISQNPNIAGAEGELADVPPGGNGLVIQPTNTNAAAYGASGDIAASAQRICDGGGGPAKPDGFIFTISSTATGGQTSDDLNGMWVCMGGYARLIADSGNSTSVKGVRMAKNGDSIQKPVCPEGTTPTIYLATAAFAEKTVKPSAITAVQSYVTDSGSSWQVNVRIKTTRQKSGAAGTTDAWVVPPTTGDDSKINYVMVQTACERYSSL